MDKDDMIRRLRVVEKGNSENLKFQVRKLSEKADAIAASHNLKPGDFVIVDPHFADEDEKGMVYLVDTISISSDGNKVVTCIFYEGGRYYYALMRPACLRKYEP